MPNSRPPATRAMEEEIAISLQELVEPLARLAAIATNAPWAIVEVDGERISIEGTSPDAPPPLREHELLSRTFDIAAAHFSDEPDATEARVCTNLEGDLPFSIVVVPLIGWAGLRRGFLGVLSVTERHWDARDVDIVSRVGEQLSAALQRRDRAQRTHRLAGVGLLAAGVAHEVNNPLAAVMAIAECLTEESLPIRVREDLVAMISEAQRAASVLRNMLAFTRQQVTDKSAVDLGEVIRRVVHLKRFHLRAANVEVDISVDESLPLLEADPGQIQQVLHNLIANARHAIPGSACRSARRSSAVMVAG